MTLNSSLHRSKLTFVCALEHSRCARQRNAVLLSTKRWNSDREKPRNKRTAYARVIHAAAQHLATSPSLFSILQHFISILFIKSVPSATIITRSHLSSIVRSSKSSSRLSRESRLSDYHRCGLRSLIREASASIEKRRSGRDRLREQNLHKLSSLHRKEFVLRRNNAANCIFNASIVD